MVKECGNFLDYGLYVFEDDILHSQQILEALAQQHTKRMPTVDTVWFIFKVVVMPSALRNKNTYPVFREDRSIR